MAHSTTYSSERLDYTGPTVDPSLADGDVARYGPPADHSPHLGHRPSHTSLTGANAGRPLPRPPGHNRPSSSGSNSSAYDSRATTGPAYRPLPRPPSQGPSAYSNGAAYPSAKPGPHRSASRAGGNHRHRAANQVLPPPIQASRYLPHTTAAGYSPSPESAGTPSSATAADHQGLPGAAPGFFQNTGPEAGGSSVAPPENDLGPPVQQQQQQQSLPSADHQAPNRQSFYEHSDYVESSHQEAATMQRSASQPAAYHPSAHLPPLPPPFLGTRSQSNQMAYPSGPHGNGYQTRPTPTLSNGGYRPPAPDAPHQANLSQGASQPGGAHDDFTVPYQPQGPNGPPDNGFYDAPPRPFYQQNPHSFTSGVPGPGPAGGGHPMSMYSDGNFPPSPGGSFVHGHRSSSPPPPSMAMVNTLRDRAVTSSDPKVQLDFAKYIITNGDQAVANDLDPVEAEKIKQGLQVEALKIIKRLASPGGFGRGAFADAQFVLADCYNKGYLGLHPDHDKAFSLYQQTSKQSHSQGTYRTAVCYEMGAGTKRDPHRAVQYYRKSAALGDTGAMYKLGVIMLKGLLSQPANSREGVTWLKRAADHADRENPHALHELALCYEKGSIPSIILDEKYAKDLYTQAAHLGYEPSQFKLGFCYEYGTLSCPQDPRRSIAWYTRAAEQGNPEAELALSGWYLTGADNILPQSDTEAYLWARKAADKGLAKAEYAVGYYAESGIGVKQDMDEARRWYMRSAAQGHKRAMSRLTELKRAGSVSANQRKKHTRGGKDEGCIIF